MDEKFATKILRTEVLKRYEDGEAARLGIIFKIKEDGSERRWRSGACEILPLERNLASSGRF